MPMKTGPTQARMQPLVFSPRAVWMVGAVEQRRRETIGVAAVRDLADELVDQVAAVSEDQNASGARSLDEADGRDGLAGPGGVLEPEATVGAGVLGRLLENILVHLFLFGPVLCFLLLGGLLLFLLLDGLLGGIGACAVGHRGLLLGGCRRGVA